MINLLASRPPVLFILLTAAICGGCSSSDTSTISPSPVTTTETFTATVDQLGSVSYPFMVSSAGPVQVKLTAVDPLATMALGVAITAGGTACGTDIAQNTNAKMGTTALTGTAAAGGYCIRVFDSGNIPAGTTVTYSGEVTHP